MTRNLSRWLVLVFWASAWAFGATQSLTIDPTTGNLNTSGVGQSGFIVPSGMQLTLNAGSTLNAQNATVVLPNTPVTTYTNIVLANLTALRAYSTSGMANGTYIQMAGYYAANDGGGGLYIWNATSTATDNGGSIIQPTGIATGRWFLQTTGPVSIRQFGATGNGTTDDSSAINAALAAWIDIYIPAGNFYVGTTSISVTRAGTTIHGSGSTSILSQSASASVPVILVNGGGIGNNRIYAEIDGVTVKSNNSGYGAGIGIELSNAFNVTLRNDYIGKDFSIGLQLVGTNDCAFYDVTMEGNGSGMILQDGTVPVNQVQFYSCKVLSNATWAIACLNGANIAYYGCDFENNGTTAQSANPISFLSMVSSGSSPGVSFTNCWFAGNHSANGELYYRSTSESGSLTLTANSFYSSDVKYNVDIDTSTAFFQGNAVAASPTTANVIFGATTRGVCWNNIVTTTTFTSGSTVSSQDGNAHVSGPLAIGANGTLQFWSSGSSYTSVAPITGGVQFSGKVSVVGQLLSNGSSINVTGSKGSNAALGSLITALAGTGLITDGTSP